MINILSDVCNQSNIIQLFLLLKIVFIIICTIIPIIILIPTVKDLIINVSNGKNEELKKTFTTFVKRLIAGLAIFFITTIINYLFTEIIPGKTQEVFTCIDSASMEKVKELREKEAEKAKEEREKREEKIEDANEKSAEEARKRAAEGKTLKKDRDEKSTTGDPNVEVSTGGITSEEFKNRLANMSTPTMSMIESAAMQNNISTDYLKIVIGTTHNEGYYNDPYLYYGWASAMLNNKVTIEQMQGWDPGHSGEANFYSETNINKGYNNATDDVKKAVYLALTERNTKIIECNGMYSVTPSSYNLLYQSSVYNCAIYETK